jgi:ElaB protein
MTIMNTSDTTSSVNRPTERSNVENGQGSSASVAGHRAEELAAAAKTEFTNIMADLQELVRRASTLSGNELSALRQQISEKLGVAREKLGHLSEDASAVAHKGVDSTEQLIKQHPLQAVGIAAVVGIAIGVLLNRR